MLGFNLTSIRFILCVLITLSIKKEKALVILKYDVGSSMNAKVPKVITNIRLLGKYSPHKQGMREKQSYPSFNLLLSRDHFSKLLTMISSLPPLDECHESFNES